MLKLNRPVQVQLNAKASGDIWEGVVLKNYDCS